MLGDLLRYGDSVGCRNHAPPRVKGMIAVMVFDTLRQLVFE
jgi:hypothetical protein